MKITKIQTSHMVTYSEDPFLCKFINLLKTYNWNIAKSPENINKDGKLITPSGWILLEIYFKDRKCLEDWWLGSDDRDEISKIDLPGYMTWNTL
jgi:hypothetical protein